MKKTKQLFRLLALLLCLVTLPAFAGAEAAKAPVTLLIAEESTLPLPQAEGFYLYVMPLLGADCMLLHNEGQWMLVDMGKRGDYPTIKQHLDRLGVDKIDIAFNTHPHSDHIGAMREIADDYPVGRFITVYSEKITGPSILQRPVLAHLQQAGVPIERMDNGSEFTFGAARVQVIKTGHNNVNGSSAVLKITYKDTSFLLAADITRQAQNRLNINDAAVLDADVFKYPHHAQEKLDAGFTEAVSPLFALITHGSKNSAEGQKWLNRYGVPYKFASWGIITVVSDGQQITVDQELTEEGKGFAERFVPQK